MRPLIPLPGWRRRRSAPYKSPASARPERSRRPYRRRPFRRGSSRAGCSYPPFQPMPAAASWGQKRYGLRRTPASLEQKSASLLSRAWFDPPDYLAAWKTMPSPRGPAFKAAPGDVSLQFSLQTMVVQFLDDSRSEPARIISSKTF